MKISNNFLLQEFVPKEIYEKWGEKAIWFVDKKIINLAQFLRERFGKPVIINDWHSGGTYKYSGYDPPGGYRPANSQSQHRFGRAIDIKVKDVFPRDVAKEIESNFSLYSKFGLTTMEDPAFTNSWTHLDVRYTGLNHLLIVRP